MTKHRIDLFCKECSWYGTADLNEDELQDEALKIALDYNCPECYSNSLIHDSEKLDNVKDN